MCKRLNGIVCINGGRFNDTTGYGSDIPRGTLIKDGKIIYHKSLGYKDLENSIPLADGDLFRIASISKSFTATAIMQLVEKGKIELEGDVSDYIGFKVRNPNFPDTKITIKMLLSHSSSLNDSEGYFNLNVINPDSSKSWTKAYNYYKPGTKYEYCNLGFNTLGTILERVSGERFDKYIVNHILKPLKLYGGYEVGSLDSTKFVRIYSYNQDGSYKWSKEAYAPRTNEIKNYNAYLTYGRQEKRYCIKYNSLCFSYF